MRLTANLDPGPFVFLDRDACPVHGWKVVREMARQPQGELLDLAHGRLLGEGEDRVLLGVRRNDVAVVPGEVAGGKVTGQRNADADVFDLVHRTFRPALRHAHHVRLGLAVLVLAKPDRHRLTSLYMWRNQTGSEEGAREGACRSQGR